MKAVNVVLLGIFVCFIKVMANEDNTNRTGVTLETRLIDTLLSHYRAHGTLARPVSDVGEAMNVYFGMRVISAEVMEKKQTLKLSVWCRMAWNDGNLKWAPEDYGGLTHVSLPHEEIWTPDIDLANTAETKVEEMLSLVTVKHDGRVFWTPRRVYSSACLIDITDYPYDQHTCELWIQSLGTNSKMLNLLPYSYSVPFDLDTFISSYKRAQEWDILNNETHRFPTPRNVGAELMYSRRVALRFRLTLRRRAGFTAYLVMAPCLLLSLMTCLLFCLPPERPDRTMLGMSLFGSFVVLLLLMVEAAPPSAASVPKLGYYYGCSLALIIFSVFCSTLVIFVSGFAESGCHVPKPIKKVFVDFLAAGLCLNWRREKIKSEQRRESLAADERFIGNIDLESLERQQIQILAEIQASSVVVSSASSDRIAPVTSGGASTWPADNNGEARTLLLRLDRKMTNLESLLISLRSSIDGGDPDSDVPRSIRLEWAALTAILDRLFFLLFLLLNIISLSMFYPRKLNN